jgi:hypothetical protein
MIASEKQWHEEQDKLMSVKDEILKFFPSATFENNTLSVEDDDEFGRVMDWLKQRHPEIVAG